MQTVVPAGWTSRFRRLGSARPLPVSVLVGLVAIAALLPSILLAFVALDRWTRHEVARERELVASLALSLSQAVDRHIEVRTDTAEVLAGSRHLVTGDLHVFDELARDAAVNARGHFILIDRNMQQLVNTRLEPGAQLPKTGNPEDIQRVFQLGRPVVTDLRRGATAGQPVFAINVPVHVAGAVRYVLAFVPVAEIIPEIVDQTYRPEGWMAAVLDGHGRLVARSHQHDQFFGRSASTFDRFVGLHGLLDTIDLQGRPSVTAYRRSTQGGWSAIVWVPKELLAAPRQRIYWLLAALVLSTLLVSLIGSWLVSHLISRPLRQLVGVARALGQGQSISFPHGRMREANIIGKAMAHAADQIAERTVALKQSEERLRLAIDAAESGFWSWDLETGERTFDQRTLEIAGWGEMAPANRDTILTHIHPADIASVRAAVHKARDPEGDGTFKAEFRIRTPSGEERWLRSQALARTSPQSTVQLIGVVRDISGRKRAEQQLQMLMREVVHRSKNLLAVVTAIARQTARTGDPASFVARFTERLNALAASHSLLVESEWKGIGVHELIESQLGHYRDFGSRLKIEGPPVQLQADAAQAIGMALHELATNATKHGALSVPVGRVTLVWRIEPGEHGRRFVMEWSEEGGPGPTAVLNPRSGFGQVVTGRMVEATVKGKVESRFRETGFVWHLEAPISCTLDPSARPNIAA